MQGRTGSTLSNAGTITAAGSAIVALNGPATVTNSGTVNGRVHVDFPIQMQGELGRTLQIPLGGGGPRVRVATTNGGVRITRG